MSEVKIKICGLSRTEDITAVNHVLPDYIGFVFAESRRKISAETAVELKKRLDGRITAVGVFVNQPVDFIAGLCQNGTIDIAQLHGDEDDGYIKRLKEICGCRVIKSVGVGGALPDLPVAADYLLFDTLSEQRGGAGRVFDWSVIKEYCGTPYFLAGGLTPENINEALRQLLPFCVDVSSGAETDGFKDSNKINELVQKVRRRQ